MMCVVGTNNETRQNLFVLSRSFRRTFALIIIVSNQKISLSSERENERNICMQFILNAGESIKMYYNKARYFITKGTSHE